MRVLFWGTPEFAAAPLRALIGEGFDVVGVVTQPDRPHGRSRSTLVAPPVKDVARKEEIPVLQPDRPRGDEFIDALRALSPDISVVVAYGHILTREVIDVPRHGTLNIHASLLPALRGAAPIQAAIRDGHAETGVTIMRMVERLDAGPIVHRQAIPVLQDETYGELLLRLTELGAQTLVEALALMEAGAVNEVAQDDSLATYAAKITRSSARIDWTRPGPEIARMIRAYDPKPGAWATLRNADARVFGARSAPDATGAPGEVLSVDKDGMIVGTGSGGVFISAVQPSGKTRLTPYALQAGRQLAVGDTLG